MFVERRTTGEEKNLSHKCSLFLEKPLKSVQRQSLSPSACLGLPLTIFTTCLCQIQLPKWPPLSEGWCAENCRYQNTTSSKQTDLVGFYSQCVYVGSLRGKPPEIFPETSLSRRLRTSLSRRFLCNVRYSDEINGSNNAALQPQKGEGGGFDHLCSLTDKGRYLCIIYCIFQTMSQIGLKNWVHTFTTTNNSCKLLASHSVFLKVCSLILTFHLNHSVGTMQMPLMISKLMYPLSLKISLNQLL